MLSIPLICHAWDILHVRRYEKEGKGAVNHSADADASAAAFPHFKRIFLTSLEREREEGGREGRDLII